MRLVALLGLLGLAFVNPATAESRPNVLFIAVDDLNACLEGMRGETTVETPNFSRLASRGVLFANAHCAAPACNPSRFAVLSGQAPST
ncbi:MAG: sulfatase-like hydrolase/transferase, partial [Verrucomicrobiota bacterium]